MKQTIVLGSNSDIMKGVMPLMIVEGWNVYGWNRHTPGIQNLPHWDLLVIAIGSVAPVEMWWHTDEYAWEQCVESNLLLPVRLLRRLWHKHNPGATVIWFAGSNPQMIMDGYSAYNVSKMAVLKAVEQFDHENRDTKFVALGPGIVLTKIHQASEEWSNPKLAAAQANGKSTPFETIWNCMKWCIVQPKSIVGGRNVCVSDDRTNWRAWLEQDSDMFKLRRLEP
jgi:NAD(P)-dependent dehydrogenase (short-subunit alcohol dehydrogenase family)